MPAFIKKKFNYLSFLPNICGISPVPFPLKLLQSGDDNENNSDDGMSEDGDFDDYYNQDDDGEVEVETTESGPKTKEDEE